MTRTPIVLPIHTQNVKTILSEETSSATEANSSLITPPSRVRNSRVIRRLATVTVLPDWVARGVPRFEEAPRNITFQDGGFRRAGASPPACWMAMPRCLEAVTTEWRSFPASVRCRRDSGLGRHEASDCRTDAIEPRVKFGSIRSRRSRAV